LNKYVYIAPLRRRRCHCHCRRHPCFPFAASTLTGGDFS
jgi:hypothetical protein